MMSYVWCLLVFILLIILLFRLYRHNSAYVNNSKRYKSLKLFKVGKHFSDAYIEAAALKRISAIYKIPVNQLSLNASFCELKLPFWCVDAMPLDFILEDIMDVAGLDIPQITHEMLTIKAYCELMVSCYHQRDPIDVIYALNIDCDDL